MRVQPESSPVSGGDAPVALYASDAVVTMPSDATLRAVAEELARDGIGLVVIGSAADVTGVMSERDVVHAVAAARDVTTTLAVDVANTTVVWCDDTATVHEVAEVMMEHYVRHVRLERNGRLVGIVSARDLLGAFTIGST